MDLGQETALFCSLSCIGIQDSGIHLLSNYVGRWTAVRPESDCPFSCSPNLIHGMVPFVEYTHQLQRCYRRGLFCQTAIQLLHLLPSHEMEMVDCA